MNFFNIGKANAEIVKLQGEVQAAKDELLVATNNLTDTETRAEQLLANDKQSSAQIVKLTADLLSAQQVISSQKAAFIELEKTIDAKASRKALEITAAQGQPQLQVKPESNPASTPSKASGLKGLAKVEAAFAAELAAR